MHIQIYSMTSIEDIDICLNAGADRIGILVSDANDGVFPCEVPEKKAYEMFRYLEGKATSVLISVGESEEEIFRQVDYLKPDVLHLCAGYTGSVEFRDHFKAKFPDIELMEAVGVTGPEAVDEARRIAQYADCIILDSVSQVVKGIGAAGVTHDWSIDKAIIEAVDVPVICAGGLGPDNVKAAIEMLHPWGVDSLTKTSDVDPKTNFPFRKNKEKVEAFCKNVRECESTTHDLKVMGL